MCAGPFGAVYDFYIERPWLARLVLGMMWGVDPQPFYRSLSRGRRAARWAPPSSTFPVEVGSPLRGLRPGRGCAGSASNIEPVMLARARRRAANHPRAEVEADRG